MKKILGLLFVIIFELALVCSIATGTVTDQTQRVQSTATADQTVFTYTWRILDEDDLDVYIDGVLTAAYSVSGVGNASGGNVTFNTGRTAGEVITIIRNMPLSQDTDYPAGGRLSTVNLEKNLDELMMIIQDLQEEINRATKMPATDTVVNIDFPTGTSQSQRASKVAAWNSTGDNLVLTTVGTSDAISVITTEGDIAQGGTGGTVERLAVGSTGDLLTVTSGKWATERSRNIAWNKGSDISNTTTIAVPDEDANYFDVTATNTIDSISSTNLDVGALVRFHFDVAATLTHSADSLVLPGGSDISVNVDDEFAFVQFATDDYRLVATTNPVAATIAQVDTGTSTIKTVTPDALAGSYAGTKGVSLTPFGPTSSVTTGDDKVHFHVPISMNGMNLVSVHAEVITAGTTGTTDIQVRNDTQAADMLSTKLTVDSGETGSDTAATPAVIDTANDDLATNDLIAIDVDAVSTTAPQGLIITLEFRLP